MEVKGIFEGTTSRFILSFSCGGDKAQATRSCGGFTHNERCLHTTFWMQSASTFFETSLLQRRSRSYDEYFGKLLSLLPRILSYVECLRSPGASLSLGNLIELSLHSHHRTSLLGAEAISKHSCGAKSTALCVPFCPPCCTQMLQDFMIRHVNLGPLDV